MAWLGANWLTAVGFTPIEAEIALLLNAFTFKALGAPECSLCTAATIPATLGGPISISDSRTPRSNEM